MRSHSHGRSLCQGGTINHRKLIYKTIVSSLAKTPMDSESELISHALHSRPTELVLPACSSTSTWDGNKLFSGQSSKTSSPTTSSGASGKLGRIWTISASPTLHLCANDPQRNAEGKTAKCKGKCNLSSDAERLLPFLKVPPARRVRKMKAKSVHPVRFGSLGVG